MKEHQIALRDTGERVNTPETGAIEMVRMLGLIYDVTLTLGFSVLCSRCCNNFPQAVRQHSFLFGRWIHDDLPLPFRLQAGPQLA